MKNIKIAKIKINQGNPYFILIDQFLLRRINFLLIDVIFCSSGEIIRLGNSLDVSFPFPPNINKRILN